MAHPICNILLVLAFIEARRQIFSYVFSENTGQEIAYFTELSGALRAIELANQFNWQNLWLESDSALVVNAFKNKFQVPWKLRNRWKNFTLITSSMNFIVSHVFREGNEYADILANIGLSSNSFKVWLDLPDCIRGPFVRTS